MNTSLSGDASSSGNESGPAPAWKILTREQRRVLGVLIEKAKTTPDQYPLSLNALTNGCNQKSNRHPQMNLTIERVEDSLDELRQMGAVAEVQGGGRVPKYRHYAKDWLGVEGAEIAVVAELLLRGTQSIGELRGRAARMAPIAGMSELKPIIASLVAKGLVVEITPAGRGQLVTHGLYNEQELTKQRAEHADGATPPPQPTPAPSASAASPSSRSPSCDSPSGASPPAAAPCPSAAPAAPTAKQPPPDVVAELRLEVAHLRTEIVKLRTEIEDIWASLK